MIWYLFQNLLNVHAQDIYIEILCILSTYINYRAYYILGFSDHKTQNKTKFNYVERAEFARETTNGFANDLLVPFKCIITLYFSHDPSIIDEFMTTKGHESLYNQERTKRSRDKNVGRRLAEYRSSSSSPPPIHQQFIQPPPPPYTTTSSYTLEGSMAFIEAMPPGSLPPILVQRLAAVVASQAANVGAGAAAVPAGAVSATPHHETPAPPSQ
ncbi:unnamed protein product [Rotaria magnacalcarata]